jgi:hypothetical protein
MRTKEPDLTLFGLVYAFKDFLEVLINLCNPNYKNGDFLSFRTHLSLMSVPLKVKDIPKLKDCFVELGLHKFYKLPPELFENQCVYVYRTESSSRMKPVETVLRMAEG